jgi:hypothetical protein
MPAISYSVLIQCFKLTNLSELNCSPIIALSSEETTQQYNQRKKYFLETMNPQIKANNPLWIYDHHSRKEFGYSIMNMRVPRGTNTLYIENDAENGYDTKVSYTIEFYDRYQRSIECKTIDALHEKNMFTIIIPARSVWFRYVIDSDEDDSYFKCHFYNGQKTCQTCRHLFERATAAAAADEDDDTEDWGFSP